MKNYTSDELTESNVFLFSKFLRGRKIKEKTLKEKTLKEYVEMALTEYEHYLKQLSNSV